MADAIDYRKRDQFADDYIVRNWIRATVFHPNSNEVRVSKVTQKSLKAAAALHLYRPTHMIGMELGISIAATACRNEATGAPICFNSDVVSIAKRELKAGEFLDGEGGYMVWGKQMPAADSMAAGGLPLGLASGIRLKNDIAKGSQLSWQDVEIDENDTTVKFRREMEAAFALPNQ